MAFPCRLVTPTAQPLQGFFLRGLEVELTDGAQVAHAESMPAFAYRQDRFVPSAFVQPPASASHSLLTCSMIPACAPPGLLAMEKDAPDTA